MKMRLTSIVCAALLTAAVAAAETPVASSISFLLAQSTIASGGTTSVSTSHVLDGSAGQVVPVGEAQSGSFVVQSGFWTSGVDEPVPVELVSFTVNSESE